MARDRGRESARRHQGQQIARSRYQRRDLEVPEELRRAAVIKA